MQPDDVEWQPIELSDVPQGKLCYYLSSKSSHLPIRDILDEQKRGCKLEPHYETRTYNFCAKCANRHVQAAVKAGCHFIFFVTRYKGKLLWCRDQYMVVGYYELDSWTALADRWAVRASKVKFVRAEDAFLVTPQICQAWGTTWGNLRYLTQRLEGELLEQLLNHFRTKPDATSGYLQEIERLQKIMSSQRRFIYEDR